MTYLEREVLRELQRHNQQAGTGSLNPYQSQLSLLTQHMLNQQAAANQQFAGLGQSLPGSPFAATTTVASPFISMGLAQRPQPAAPLETGTKVEDLIGWRIWIITDSGMLKSYSLGSIWLPGQPMTGEPGDHDSVGVWAFKGMDSAIAKLNGHNAAAGSVRLWGQVVEHEHGYRAQFARIVSIDCVSLPGKFPWDRSQIRALKWLRQTYGVEA